VVQLVKQWPLSLSNIDGARELVGLPAALLAGAVSRMFHKHGICLYGLQSVPHMATEHVACHMPLVLMLHHDGLAAW
jgi:hypothetical protein